MSDSNWIKHPNSLQTRQHAAEWRDNAFKIPNISNEIKTKNNISNAHDV